MPSGSSWLRGAVVALCLVAPLAAVPADDPVLAVGDLAPDFRLVGSDGRTYTLSEFRGVKPVVIAWFPKAMAKT